MERNRYDRVAYRNLLGEMVKSGENYGTLAELCDVEEQTIGKKMRGEAPFTVLQADVICKHFNMPFEYLFSTN